MPMSQSERHAFIHYALVPSVGFTVGLAVLFGGALVLPVWVLLPSVVGRFTWAGWRTMSGGA